MPTKNYELLNIQVCSPDVFWNRGRTQSLVVNCRYWVVPLISTRDSGYSHVILLVLLAVFVVMDEPLACTVVQEYGFHWQLICTFGIMEREEFTHGFLALMHVFQLFFSSGMIFWHCLLCTLHFISHARIPLTLSYKARQSLSQRAMQVGPTLAQHRYCRPDIWANVDPTWILLSRWLCTQSNVIVTKSNVGRPNIGPTSVQTSRRWANVHPTWISLSRWECT